MIKNEWNQLWKKPGLVAALLAIALIPAIYCFLYLSSMWNTYGRVDHIPVAVVNHDQATAVHGRSIDIGRQLTNKLNDSKSMDYHVTTAKAARKGIRTGDYDMVVTIPHDFSKRATTLLTKTPQPALLKFTINSGRNFIVSKMTTGATTAIRANVSKQVSQINVAALLSAFKGAQVGMATAGQKSGTVTAGLTKISQGLQTVAGENQKLDQQLGANQAAHAIAAQTAGLTAGTQQATAGEQLLTSHLTKGAIQLAQIKQTNKTAKVLASPVESSTTDVAKVPNNGTGMAPFSIAIGVFVGGIGLGTMFDASYSKKHTDSAWRYWCGKFSIIGAVGLLQAGVLIPTLAFGNGLHAVNEGKLSVMILLGALTFLSLIFCLRVVLGDFGTWLITILLVVQLSAAAGLYPV